MYKFLFLLIFSIPVTCAYGQTDSLTREESQLLDSMFKSDEFIKLMMKKEKSYVDVNAGMGNGIFSLKNNALNAGQAQTNKIYYTASAGYFHKSGMALSVSGFVAADNGGLKMFQYAISPSYMYGNKKLIAGISYTRFIKGSAADFDVNPFKNDFYASVVYKKKWIEPGLSLGFSFGRQQEYFDTSFWLLSRVVHIRDTITTKISGLSVILSATHKWYFYELINKKDAIQLQPTLLLNAGSQRWRITHSNSLSNRRPVIQYYLKSRYGDGRASESFNLQSVAFAAQATYYYGNFYLLPKIYLDYYLPTTTEKRLTSLFSITAGVSLY